jgi:hypothetical protein
MCGPRVEIFRSREGGSPAPALSCSPRLRAGRSCAPASVRQPAATYMASNVSITSIEEPPASTGQPLASATAAPRLSALMIV